MSRRKVGILAVLREVFRSNQVRKQRERVEAAVREHAQLESEVRYQHVMAQYYTGRVAEITPAHNWWEYAEAKQKEHDHVEEYVQLLQQCGEAAARVDAEKARMQGDTVRADDEPAVAGGENS